MSRLDLPERDAPAGSRAADRTGFHSPGMKHRLPYRRRLYFVEWVALVWFVSKVVAVAGLVVWALVLFHGYEPSVVP